MLEKMQTQGHDGSNCPTCGKAEHVPGVRLFDGLVQVRPFACSRCGTPRVKAGGKLIFLDRPAGLLLA